MGSPFPLWMLPALPATSLRYHCRPSPCPLTPRCCIPISPPSPSSSSPAVAKGLLLLWAVPARSTQPPSPQQTQALVRLMAEDAQELFKLYVSATSGGRGRWGRAAVPPVTPSPPVTPFPPVTPLPPVTPFPPGNPNAFPASRSWSSTCPTTCAGPTACWSGCGGQWGHGRGICELCTAP